MNFRPPSTRRQEPQLDLTPLIDVVFLLLIFFMVTATFATQSNESTVPLDLPEGATGEESAANEEFSVFLEASGTLTFRQPGARDLQTDSIMELRQALEGLQRNNPRAPIYLRGDREVPYGRVMEVLDTLRAAGFMQIYNVVESSGP